MRSAQRQPAPGTSSLQLLGEQHLRGLEEVNSMKTWIVFFATVTIACKPSGASDSGVAGTEEKAKLPLLTELALDEVTDDDYISAAAEGADQKLEATTVGTWAPAGRRRLHGTLLQKDGSPAEPHALSLQEASG